MILFLIEFFSSLGVKIPAVFSYNSTRMLLAAITSLVLCIFAGPRFIKFLCDFKIRESTRSEAKELAVLEALHKNKKNTPTMGGMLILCSMLVSMFLWMDLTHIFTLILFITTVVLGLLGARDDLLKLKHKKNSEGLSGKKKLLIQATLSGIIALYLLSPMIQDAVHMGQWFAPPVVKEDIITQISVQEYAERIYFPFVKEPVFILSGGLAILAGLFIMFVITGASNAVNLTDGLDGLAAGCLLMVATCLALIAFVSNNIDIAGYLNILYIEGSGEIAIYLSAFVGACLGFLWYNGHPAEIFMGDTGSLALGGLIGVSAVLLKREFLLGLIGGIFVAETLSVIIQVLSFKYRNKKRVFLCSPLHHHFEYKGWPETKVVLRFWIVGLLLALLGVASLKFQ
jgi:phospho-N-acetylmuramoyl-pentapeptide-transferase